MRNVFSIIVFALLPVLLFAQKGSLPVSVDLEIGQAFKLKEAKVKFIRVIADSRCPKQVTCIWPGEAKVLLGITVMGEYLEREVVISGTGAEIALAEDFQILISQLIPYPETAKKIAPEDYCLSFAAILGE